MLKLTENAAAAIQSMLEDSDLSEGAGLRITAELDENQQPGLQLAFVEEPGEEDEIVETHGVTVFLDPSAAEALDDKELDAELHGDHAHFSIDDQASA